MTDEHTLHTHDDGTVHEHADGAVHTHADGTVHANVDGVDHEHAGGVVHVHVDNAHIHADDTAHVHADGTVHEHADGTVHTHADGTVHTHALDEIEHAHTGDGAVLHSHLHAHADGTVHNHFHVHEGGDVPHEHDELTSHDHDAGEALPVHGGEEVLPEHVHAHLASHRVILEAHDLAFTFPHASTPVFEGVSFEAHAGTVTAILGNNGAGKSTLLNLLGRMNKPTAGKVVVGGTDLASMNRRQIAQHIAYVSQQQRIPHLSVYDEVLLGRKPHVSWSITDNDRAVVAAAIERLGLESFASRYCDELSGGERQKVYIARALAQETEVLLLDEPTSALDPKNQMEVLRVVREITTQTSLATIMVIHDVNLALRFSDVFLLMRNGQVVSQGGSEAVTAETLSQTYDMPMRVLEFEGTKLVIP